MPQAPDYIDDLWKVGVYDATITDGMDITTLSENSAAWATYDWSGVAVLAGDGTSNTLGAALISDSYAIVAWHAPSTAYQWLGRNGVAYSSTRGSTTRIESTDLAIAELTTPPPTAHCARYKIPLRLDDWMPTRAIWIDRDGLLTLVNATNVTSEDMQIENSVFGSGTASSGDSSKPVFLPYDNGLLVVGGFESLTKIPASSLFISQISAVVSPEVISTVDPEFNTVRRESLAYANLSTLSER